MLLLSDGRVAVWELLSNGLLSCLSYEVRELSTSQNNTQSEASCLYGV